AERPTPTPIPKLAEAITVDGKLEKPCWKQAPPVRVDYIHGKVGTLSSEPRAIAKYLWDDHYLYIGYETFDKNLVAIGTGEKQGPPGNQREGCEISVEGKKVDVVEFFISLGDESFFWEIHHNAANQFNDIWCTLFPENHPIYNSTLSTWGIHFANEEYLKDEGEYKVAMAVQLKPKADGKPSTINDDSDVDTGYTGEIRIPWAALGAPRDRQTWLDPETGKPVSQRKPKSAPGPWKMEGLVVLIMAVVQDGDLKDRYHHSSPTFKGGWFHKGAAEWPRYVLTSAAAK
ncbi:MAG: sugar-binding protein, partial [Planctomycetota bacterium]